MRSINSLPIKNLVRKPARSLALIFISAFLALSAFGGTVMVMSLSNGINSLSARLGADIIVTPYAATSQVSYDSVIIQGKPGQFYMDSKYYEEIKTEIEGIDKITAQFYLASAKASCCSSRLQIIGFDPATDFSIQPWVEKSYSDKLGLYDAVVGSDVTPNTDMTVEIYGKTLHVQAVLDKTGTELDSALYVDIDTMKELIRAHNEKNPNQEKTIDPDNVVSSVLIKVADGYDIDEVAGDINLHVRQVKAIRTQNMISGVSESLSGVSATISLLMVVVWILSAVILAIVFTMNINERKKEFAVLRVLGASRVKLAGLVFREAALYGFLGSLLGAGMTVLITALFTPAIENMIGLPFLLPPVPVMLIAGALTVVLTIAAGAVTAASSAVKISKIDTGLILRGDD
ncbi:MAG: FtsX-like permease family protein [Ruminococcus sp.]|nr:FtsX-like permease family protein [Ruminococcus sp.]